MKPKQHGRQLGRAPLSTQPWEGHSGPRSHQKEHGPVSADGRGKPSSLSPSSLTSGSNQRSYKIMKNSQSGLDHSSLTQ